MEDGRKEFIQESIQFLEENDHFSENKNFGESIKQIIHKLKDFQSNQDDYSIRFEVVEDLQQLHHELSESGNNNSAEYLENIKQKVIAL